MMKTITKFFLFLSFFMLFIFSLISTSNAKTTAKIEDCKLEVTVNIALYGPGASEAYANKVKQSSEKVWNDEKIKCGDECKCTFHLTVNVIRVDNCNKPEASGHHCIHVKQVPVGTFFRPVIYGTVDKWNKEDKDNNKDANIPSGSGRLGSQDEPKMIAHEVGHLFGLDDQYTDVYYYCYQKPDGNCDGPVKHIPTKDFTPAKKAEIEGNKPAGTTMKYFQNTASGGWSWSRPHDGKGKSIMAQVGATAKPLDEHAQDVLKKTGLKCPDECCCGDGKVQGNKGESCDPKANPTGCSDKQKCSEKCKCAVITPVCGDGEITSPEECDPKKNPTGCKDNHECDNNCKCKEKKSTTTEPTNTEKVTHKITEPVVHDTPVDILPGDYDGDEGEGTTTSEPTSTPTPTATATPTEEVTPTPTPTEEVTPTEEPGILPAELNRTPASINLGLVDRDGFVMISNEGEEELIWNISSSCGFGVDIGPPGGALPAMGNMELFVHVIREEFAPGTHSCSFTIMSNGGNKSVTVSWENEGEPESM